MHYLRITNNCLYYGITTPTLSAAGKSSVMTWTVLQTDELQRCVMIAHRTNDF